MENKTTAHEVRPGRRWTLGVPSGEAEGKAVIALKTCTTQRKAENSHEVLGAQGEPHNMGVKQL